MNLTCPSCGTRFRLPDGAVGDKGRKLRCASCKHVWFQAPETHVVLPPDPASTPSETTPPAPEPAAEAEHHEPAAPTAETHEAPQHEVDETAPEPEVPAERFRPVPIDEEPEPTEKPEPDAAPIRAMPYSAALAAEATVSPQAEDEHSEADSNEASPDETAEPAYDISRVVAPDAAPDEKTKPKSRGSGGKLFLMLLILLVTAALAAYHWRADIMRVVPTTVDYYELTGLVGPPSPSGLEIRDAGFSVEIEDGHSLMVVNGRLVNTSSEFQRLPELRIEILDGSKMTLHDWRFKATASGLGPGYETWFRTTYPDPPRSTDANYLMVTFDDVR
ncbi:MAG: hypothetical protein CMM46_09550 [Rhodospirillaceae bacterium]|nr:hypothetical protein [Rhodospirillaceae bacterium]